MYNELGTFPSFFVCMYVYLHVCTILKTHILSISDSTTGYEADFQTINELHEHEAEIHDADDQKPVVSFFCFLTTCISRSFMIIFCPCPTTPLSELIYFT